MLKQILFLFLVIFNCILSFSQEIEKYNESDLIKIKKKFYLNKEIGVDSSLYYMNKLLLSNNTAYKTFGYAAIEYLKVREKQSINTSFKDSINKYLPKIVRVNKNFPLLFDIHILLGNSNKRRKLIKPALQNYITFCTELYESNVMADNVKAGIGIFRPNEAHKGLDLGSL